MLTLVLGTPDCGKSSLAEDLVTACAKGKKAAYIATMIPFGEEGQKRIEKHRSMRAGKPFVTFEQPTGVDALADKLKQAGISAALLECVSNLAGNELYSAENAALSEAEIGRRVAKEILTLSASLEELVAVTNEFADSPDYDRETRRYIAVTHHVNEILLETARRCFVYTGEGWKESHKDENPV